MKRVHLAVGVLACCIIGSQALSATAGSPRAPETVRLTATVDSVQQVDNGAPGDSQGDMLVFTQKLTDRTGKQIGTSSAYCVRTAVGKARECQGTFFLPKGQVFVSGPDPDGVRRHALAIVGGTRAYEDVGGHVTLDHETPVQDRDTFHFER
jgi:hypothetical protein